MNRIQKRKLWGIICIAMLASIAVGLVLYALKQNINLFYTPTELLQSTIHPDQNLRIGGYVKINSVHYDSSGESVNFTVTDRKNDLQVNYHGVLPNLFREGQTVVITGKLNADHQLVASEVLAKHDEKYMPRQLKNLQSGAGYGS